MVVLVCMVLFLLLVCVAMAVSMLRAKRQWAEWLGYLRAVRDTPERKVFVKGRGVLAEINYEINGILEENRKQLLRLAEAEAANKQVLTSVAHDVRTPLASLLGYLEALDSGRVKEGEWEEYIHVAYRKAEDLEGLAEVLFEWFKINSGEQKYEMAVYDVNELTREFAIGYLPAWERQNVVARMDISDEEYLIWVDRVAYGRILDNLFSNAIRHGKCREITISIQKCGGDILVKVGNDGEAIPQAQLPFIFMRLYKGDASRSGVGSGLGLAVVKELVSAMDGEISVESKEGGGAVFLMSFPLRGEVRNCS